VSSLVLVWPLCGSGGDGGSRVPLAFGWEVPVSIRWSAEQDAARGAGLQSEGRGEKAQVRFSLNGRRKGYYVVLKFSDIDVIICDILI
jgi:hypothetical protein